MATISVHSPIALPATAANETGKWLRVYQPGASRWYNAPQDGFGDIQIADVKAGVPCVVFWFGTYDKTTVHPDEEPWLTKTTRAYAIVPFIDTSSPIVITLVDPSVRDDEQRYLPQTSATVTLTGSPFSARDVAVYMKRLKTVFGLARSEMRSFTVTKAALQRPIIEVARDIFLNRFTSVAGQLTAASFAALGQRDAPMRRSVLEYLVRFACSLLNEDYDTILRAMARRETGNILPRVLEVMVEAVVFTAVSSVYVGDHAGRREVERFQIPAACRLGQCDCEDCAKETMHCVTSIQKMRLPPHDPLAPFVRLLNYYTPLMITGLATSPSLPRDQKEVATDPRFYICHVWAVLVPRRVVARWTNGVQDTSPLDPLETRLINMGTLLCEGTNYTGALHRPMTAYYDSPADAQAAADATDKALAMRHAIETKGSPTEHMSLLDYRSPGKLRMKEPKTFADASGFYRVAITIWVPLPSADNAPFAFNLVMGDTFGVSFYDLLRCHKDIRATPAFERQLSRAELDFALSFEPPRKPLDPEKMGMDVPTPPAPANEVFVEWRMQSVNQVTPNVKAAIEALRATYDVYFYDYYLTKNIHGISQIKAFPK